MPDARREGMTEWTPDQPLRADATRQQVIDRMSHLHREAKSIGDATAPFYAVAMVDEVQKALRAELAAAREDSARLEAKACASLAVAQADSKRLQRENEELTGVIETFGRVSFLTDPDRDDLELRYRVAGVVFRAGGMTVFSHAIRECAQQWEEKLRAIRMAHRTPAEKLSDALADVERNARAASRPFDTTTEGK